MTIHSQIHQIRHLIRTVHKWLAWPGLFPFIFRGGFPTGLNIKGKAWPRKTIGDVYISILYIQCTTLTSTFTDSCRCAWPSFWTFHSTQPDKHAHTCMRNVSRRQMHKSNFTSFTYSVRIFRESFACMYNFFISRE